jgi:hypothetical protein
MKKIYMVLAAVIANCAAFSQTVSNFENITLGTDTFNDGSDLSSGFQTGNAFFNNTYAGYSTGFAVTNKTNTTTAGYTNSYSSITGGGYSSTNYAVANVSGDAAKIRLNGAAAGKAVNGFYITNTTYAYLSMKDGDQFAKKFGGVSGNDPDFFLLTIKAWSGGVLKTDSVNFYLADYRFSDNSKDFVLDAWAWIDLKSLGNTDSLVFYLSSSDNGQFGMNTPSYFALDNFTTSDGVTALNDIAGKNILKAYPNPVSKGASLNIELDETESNEVAVYTLAGQEVMQATINNSKLHTFATTELTGGAYLVKVINSNGTSITRVIVE